jgi:hypothetical protein
MKSVTTKIKMFAAVATLVFSSNALADCFTDLSDIATLQSVNNISARWVQTDADDGKPVTINLRETGDGLFVSFIKDGNVLTEGHVQICQDNNNQLVLRPIGQLSAGPNAPQRLRDAMTNRGTRIRFSIPSESRMNVRISVPVILGASMTMPMTFQSH